MYQEALTLLSRIEIKCTGIWECLFAMSLRHPLPVAVSVFPEYIQEIYSHSYPFLRWIIQSEYKFTRLNLYSECVSVSWNTTECVSVCWCCIPKIIGLFCKRARQKRRYFVFADDVFHRTCLPRTCFPRTCIPFQYKLTVSAWKTVSVWKNLIEKEYKFVEDKFVEDKFCGYKASACHLHADDMQMLHMKEYCHLQRNTSSWKTSSWKTSSWKTSSVNTKPWLMHADDSTPSYTKLVFTLTQSFSIQFDCVSVFLFLLKSFSGDIQSHTHPPAVDPPPKHTHTHTHAQQQQWHHQALH